VVGFVPSIPAEDADHGSNENIKIDDIDDAISVATQKLALLPGSSFQARVSQLSQLNTAHKTVRKLLLI
jgi:hypothetical protein